MIDVDALIEERIGAFAADLEGLLRQAALQIVAEVLTAREAPVRVAARPVAVTSAPKTTRRGATGPKRDPKELDALTESAFVFIDGHAAHTAVEIAAGLAVSTTQLALPIKRLLAAKRIRKSGERDRTRYFSV